MSTETNAKTTEELKAEAKAAMEARKAELAEAKKAEEAKKVEKAKEVAEAKKDKEAEALEKAKVELEKVKADLAAEKAANIAIAKMGGVQTTGKQLSPEEAPSDGAVYKNINAHIIDVYGPKLANPKEYCTPYRYNEALAEKKGSFYSLHYGGVDYPFEVNKTTQILKEHFNGVVAILEDGYKAKGGKVEE